MKTYGLVATVAMSLICAGFDAGGAELSRGKAKELIEKNPGFLSRAGITSPVGVNRVLLGTYTTSFGRAGVRNERDNAMFLRLLSAKGLITFTTDQSGPEPVVDVRLTDKGNAFVVARPNAWSVIVRLCERTIDKITGIERQGSQALAEFDYKFVKLTPFGEMSNACSGVQQGKALFRLFDDGWRLAGIDF